VSSRRPLLRSVRRPRGDSQLVRLRCAPLGCYSPLDPPSLLLAFEDGLYLKLESDCLAEHEPTGLEGCVVEDAKIVLVDLAGRRKAHAGPHLRMRDDAEIFGLQRHGLGDATDGEVPGQREPGARLVNQTERTERDHWVVRNVEEVGRTDVGVPVRLARVDAR